MILIVSPHLDDAALSCADHALAWRALGHSVRVLTLFSAAGNCVSPLAGGPVRSLSDCDSYMRRRRSEDGEALARLGLEGEYLELADAVFRGEGTPDFPDLRHLWAGTVGPHGDVLVERTAAALRVRGVDASMVLCPLSVGGHVDHVIARQACERVFVPTTLAYYADMPYARAPWRWQAAQVRVALRCRRSWRWISRRKLEALRAYESQMPQLFRSTPRFPELVLYPVPGNPAQSQVQAA